MRPVAIRRTAFVALVASLIAGRADAAGIHVRGEFAIAGATPKVAATLAVEPMGPLSAKLDLWETANGTTIRQYDLDMTQRLHLIVISADFDWFSHLHPALGADGHFAIDLDVPKPARYYIFADADPRGAGKQVFRFSVVFGRMAPGAPDLSATAQAAVAGPYVVTLESLVLHRSAATDIGVRITKGGLLADLHPYLGAVAHAVFVNALTLDYVHVHPAPAGAPGSMAGMPMPGMAPRPIEMPPLLDDARVSGSMTLHVSPVPAGTYKLWLQFRGANGLEVASFVLHAR